MGVIRYPGKVGSEYFMTKGHFQNILESAEVYYCVERDGRPEIIDNPKWKY
ncbi:MAG: hypothetical protein JSV31_14325 [Desulfobacterales bacterium]|nr:MAG: hypothetical protein JSV31_14325 [Desulfobacterales bacterium]